MNYEYEKYSFKKLGPSISKTILHGPPWGGGFGLLLFDPLLNVGGIKKLFSPLSSGKKVIQKHHPKRNASAKEHPRRNWTWQPIPPGGGR